MKLSDIFEAYLDKFYRSGWVKRMLQDPNYTFNDLADDLDTMGIYFLPVYVSGEGYGGGSLIDLEDTIQYYKSSGREIDPELISMVEDGYKNILRMAVPELKFRMEQTLESTGRKDDIFELLQHELQHRPQPMGMSSQYIPPSKTLSPEEDLQYIIQPLEKANMAVNIASALLSINLTPKDFMSDVERVARRATQEANKYDVKRVAEELLYQLRGGIYGHLTSGWLEIIVKANAMLITQIESAKKNKSGDLKKLNGIKRRLELFFRQLEKTYKRVKGYQQRYH